MSVGEEVYNFSSSVSSSLSAFSENYKKFHSPLVIVICLFGVVCNLANVIVLTKPKMRTSPTNVILTGLSLAQICLLINYLCYTVYELMDDDCSASTKTYSWLVYLLLNVNLNVLFHTIGLVHTSLIAIFRYIAVAFAATRSHWVTVHRAKQAVVGTYAIVPLACATFYFNSLIVETCLLPNCTSAPSTTVCNNTTTAGGDSSDGDQIYKLSFTSNDALLAYNFWMLATVCKLLPCFCLVVLSALLLVELHKVQQRRRRLHRQSTTSSSSIGDDQQHQRITIMLIVVVLLFVFVELPQGVFNLLSSVGGFNTTIRRVHNELADFFDMLTVSYSSVNFVLYCTMSSQFRQSFGEIFWSSYWTKWKTRRKNHRKRSRAVYLPVRGVGDASPMTLNGLLTSSSDNL